MSHPWFNSIGIQSGIGVPIRIRSFTESHFLCHFPGKNGFLFIASFSGKQWSAFKKRLLIGWYDCKKWWKTQAKSIFG